MQKRLRAIGLRPINALVDITNYITFDRGRPLHVFDAAKVAGALHVRRARGRREPARARRQDPCARRKHGRHRRRQRRRIDRRHHGRRTFRLRREHDRRADRERVVGSAQYRADRPQARHRHRRALSLRTRRRSRLLRSRRGACDADDARTLRRRGLASRRRRLAGDARQDHRLPVQRSRAAHRPRYRAEPKARRSCASSALWSMAARSPCRPGVPISTAKPISSSRSCASPDCSASRRGRCRDCRPACPSRC